jgi:hypothetical protein
MMSVLKMRDTGLPFPPTLKTKACPEEVDREVCCGSILHRGSPRRSGGTSSSGVNTTSLAPGSMSIFARAIPFNLGI